MKKILIYGLSSILVLYFVISGYFAFRREIPRSAVGELQSVGFEVTPNYKGIVDMTLLMAGGTLNLSAANSNTTSVSVKTNYQDWLPIETVTDTGYRIEQPVRPSNNWQPVDYITNDWVISTGSTPIDLKIDARIWDGELDLSGINLTGFQLADLDSHSMIRFTQPTTTFDTMIIDSLRSNMKVYGLLNSGARNAILKVPFGNYLLDFSGDLQEDMSAVITTGLGKTRIEISDTVNVRITYTGQTRKSTIEGDWIRLEGTTYVRTNPGNLLDIVVNSDQGDLEVVIVN
jgi:hypothetical protein